MISSLTPAAQAFVNGINQISQAMQTAQLQLTTGLKINSVADDPTALPLLAETQSQLAQVQQINKNLGSVNSEVNAGESGLESAVTLMEQAQTLATQGQPTSTTAASRQQIAAQVGAILQQMVGIANTSSGGRYLFSGDSDQTQPYTFDSTQSPPVSAYQGSASTRQVQAPDGSTFPVALTAQQIFDTSDPTTSVFQSLTSLQTALANNDQTGIDSSISNLSSADQFLNQQLAFYGVAQDEVQAAQTNGSTMVTQLQTQLSGIQDADSTQSITELTQATTQQQAALASWSKLPQTSLFNYLG